MAEEDRIYLNKGANQRQQGEDLHIDHHEGNDFGEEAAFTCGISYMVASVLGIAKGGYEGVLMTKSNMPKKLILNTIFNQLGKTQSSWGQAAASASFLYFMMGRTLNLLLEDELASFTNLQKNILCGSLTGAVYKSTLGWTPMGVGGLLGGTVIGGLTVLCDALNKRGYIGYQMKY